MLAADALLILALNTFNEARSESAIGQRAVAEVVLNRATSSCYPSSIKEVVYQKNQFSWVKQKGHARTPTQAKRDDADAWDKALLNAKLAVQKPAIVPGANMYHALSVKPAWASKAKFIKRVGNHVFYKLPCS